MSKSLCTTIQSLISPAHPSTVSTAGVVPAGLNAKYNCIVSVELYHEATLTGYVYWLMRLCILANHLKVNHEVTPSNTHKYIILSINTQSQNKELECCL